MPVTPGDSLESKRQREQKSRYDERMSGRKGEVEAEK